MSQHQDEIRDLELFREQALKSGSLSQREQLNFILKQASQYIEAVIDEGIRISQLMTQEKSEDPETVAQLEVRIEQRLRRKERVQKKLLVEYLLNFQKQAMDNDFSSEREAFNRDARRIEMLLSNEISFRSDSEAQNESRDRLLAIVSHELRSPLTAIFMGAEIIRTSIDEDSTDTLKIMKLTKMIERNAGLMDRLIRDLMDAERISHGKLSLNPENHRISELLHFCQEEFIPTARAKGIDLQFQMEDEHIATDFDFDRMVQALSNLISNAIKFTPKGGEILVSCQYSHPEIKIMVQDSGPGIPENDRTHVFERFSQLNLNDQRGLGLGLFIAKWIVEAHQGKIGVDSTAGQGSQFFISLPADLVH